MEIHPNPDCEYCGEKFDSMYRLDQHKVINCNKITESCVLKGFGCSVPIVRSQISDHYMSKQHQNAIINLIQHSPFTLSKKQYPGSSNMEIDMFPHNDSSNTDNSNDQMQSIYKTIDTIASGVQALNGDIQNLSTESIGSQIMVEDITHELAALKLSVQEENTFLDGFKPNQEILKQDVESLKEKVNDMQYVSYDGVLIWKISHFQEKMSKYFLVTFCFYGNHANHPI